MRYLLKIQPIFFLIQTFINKRTNKQVNKHENQFMNERKYTKMNKTRNKIMNKCKQKDYKKTGSIKNEKSYNIKKIRKSYR